MFLFTVLLVATAAKKHHGCVKHPHTLLREVPGLWDHEQSKDLGLTADVLPEVFDWRNVSGQSFVTRTLNQHIPVYCGSCWAHAATSTFSDRLKILRNAQWPDINLSVQYSLNCLTEAGTCFGGSDLLLYEQWTHHGVPDETCEVYVAKDEKCTPQNKCRNCFGPPGKGTCFPQPKYLEYKAENYGFIKNDDVPDDLDILGFATVGDVPVTNNTTIMVHNMKKEIMDNGPISCVVDADVMFDYETGVLDTQGTEINHVVSVAGWGKDESNTEYWIVRNSWGTYWGDHGWIYLKTGVNAALVEAFCSWVTPAWPPRQVVQNNDDEEWNEVLFIRNEEDDPFFVQEDVSAILEDSDLDSPPNFVVM